ncbi:MAG: hypothetical protein PUH10_08835 [Erysipelotrichaceae bacterium]|uniref:hypothetical protein n=1 Tax=Floccifex sp. TaxID=2815810 RepID=UPI002A766B9D|nr:hypothetical protein [Floccifex sp.]MDD7282073.1 hypothetical protein [Erysipelotrichaceae bacterium]MDY2958983.1 hypothetical protein [Floccifex sp.]
MKIGFYVLILLLNILSISSCFSLLCIEQVNAIVLCRLFFCVFIILGIYFILKFYLKKLYKCLNEYSFSIGVLCLLFGCIGCIQSNEISNYFNICIGILVLVIGVLSLQWTIQLYYLENPFYGSQLIISLVMMVCAVCVIMDFSIIYVIEDFPIWLLLICSILNLISLIIVSLSLKKDNN